jgi:hypothetical protein
MELIKIVKRLLVASLGSPQKLVLVGLRHFGQIWI